MKTLYLVGNGFDIQHGIRTPYSEFRSFLETHHESFLTDFEAMYNIQPLDDSDNVYQYLLYFDKLYDKFTDAEKKEFLSSFVERVDIYEDELPDGRFLRHIKFKFPVFYNGQEIDEMSWDKESTVECVVQLFREDTFTSV